MTVQCDTHILKSKREEKQSPTIIIIEWRSIKKKNVSSDGEYVCVYISHGIT